MRLHHTYNNWFHVNIRVTEKCLDFHTIECFWFPFHVNLDFLYVHSVLATLILHRVSSWKVSDVVSGGDVTGVSEIFFDIVIKVWENGVVIIKSASILHLFWGKFHKTYDIIMQTKVFLTKKPPKSSK